MDLKKNSYAELITRSITGSELLNVRPETFRKIFNSRDGYIVIYTGNEGRDFEQFKKAGKDLVGLARFYHNFESATKRLMKNDDVVLTRDLGGNRQVFRYTPGELDSNQLVSFVIDHTMGAVTNVNHSFARKKMFSSPRPQVYLAVNGIDPSSSFYSEFYKAAKKLWQSANFFIIDTKTSIGREVADSIEISHTPSVHFMYYTSDLTPMQAELEEDINELNTIAFVNNCIEQFLEEGDFLTQRSQRKEDEDEVDL